MKRLKTEDVRFLEEPCSLSQEKIYIMNKNLWFGHLKKVMMVDCFHDSFQIILPVLP